jgi:hypothetical protein
MKNGIDDLRNHLFETLEALKDKDDPMELERAKAIAEVSQTIINVAKVEVEFMKSTGQETGSKFFAPKPVLPRPMIDGQKARP